MMISFKFELWFFSFYSSKKNKIIIWKLNLFDDPFCVYWKRTSLDSRVWRPRVNGSSSHSVDRPVDNLHSIVF